MGKLNGLLLMARSSGEMESMLQMGWVFLQKWLTLKRTWDHTR